MARLPFPSDRTAYVAEPYGGAPLLSAAGLAAKVYADAGGTALADVQNFDGTANPTATFAVDSTSRMPLFLGPADGTDTLYVQAGTGPVTAVTALGPNDVSAAVGAEVAARAAGDVASVARAAAFNLIFGG